MDRVTNYREQIPYESDFMGGQRFSYEGQGLLALDLFGKTTQVAGLACTATSPASLSFNVGPGRIYSFQPLEVTAWGVINSTGGLAADTTADHYILKQGILRDTQTFTVTAPATTGQSQVFLIEAQFVEADDPAITVVQFYNTQNPNAPLSQELSANRRDQCALQMKAGVAATTGSQVTPSADAGWVPVWAITVAYGQTTITSANIAAAAGAPFLVSALGGSGSGSGTVTTKNWTTVNANYTAQAGDLLIADSSTAGFTITLPTSPTADQTTVKVKGHFATNNVTLSSGSANINLGAAGMSSTYVLNADLVEVSLVYAGTSLGWITN